MTAKIVASSEKSGPATRVVVIHALPAGSLTLSLDDDGFLPDTPDWFSQRHSAEGQRTHSALVKVVTATGEEL